MTVQGLLAAALGTLLLVVEPDAAGLQNENLSRLDPAALALEVGAPVGIRLPDGTPLELIVTGRRHHPSGNVTLLARPGDPAQSGYLVTLTGQANTGLVGTVLSPQGEFRLVARDGPPHQSSMERVVPPASAWHDDVIWHSPPASYPAVPLDADTMSDESTTPINVLVLYTFGAREGRDEAEWTAFLDNLFAVTNDAYSRSGAQVEFSRVGERLVAASETVGSVELLSHMMPHSGAFDAAMFGEVEDWRLAADAHLVALLRRWQPSQSNCGAAGLTACGDDAQCYNADLGYSVTSLGDCTALTLAHELGHNLGCAHEPGLDFETEDGTARAGTHYTATAGSFAWSDGADGAYTITVPLTPGGARGQDRTFSVVLRNLSAGATLGTPAAADVTITAQPGGGGGGGAIGPWSLLLAGALLVVSARAPGTRRRQDNFRSFTPSSWLS